MIKIGPASERDLELVAKIFLACFEDSVDHLFGDFRPSLKGPRDLFAFLLSTEPEAFFVALDGKHVVGYAVTPRSVRRLWREAIFKGYIFRWAWRWVRGNYGFGFAPLRPLLLNKWCFIRSPHNFRQCDAQILSIAVSPEARGRGIASGLMEQALKYLQDCGVPEVKLEVRPWNTPAQRLYQRFGFSCVGTTRDSQGEWNVMLKRLKGNT